MRGAPPSVLLAFYCALAAAPLLLIGALQDGIAAAGAMRALAVATGIVALALVLLQFLSSGRFGLFSGHAGMDRVMRFHQLAARALVAIAVLHPLLFLMPQDGIAWREVPARAAALFTAPHLASGTAAWLLLLLIVAMGVLRKRLPLRYETWRGSHALLAIIVAGAGLHHAYAAGSYSGAQPLALWWGLMAGLAFGTLGYLYLLKPLLLARRAYRVVSNEEIGHGIREIALEPARGRALSFQAGQFAWVLLDQPPLTLLDHPFSISSAPAELPRVRLLVKARGDFTSGLGSVQPGARAYLDGPHGNFTLTGRSGASLALFAGGIGIAPIISLLRQLSADRDGRRIGLVYGARNIRQLVHADEIRAIARRIDLRYSFLVDEPEPGWDGGVGEISLDAVRAALRGDPAAALCFVCGPTPMMLACRTHLLASGVRRTGIVMERFDYD